MIKLWKRIPRKWKIVLDGTVILVLLFALWAALDYPMPSARLAFRRAVAGVGYSAQDPDVILNLEYDRAESARLETTEWTVGLLAEKNGVVRVSLYQELGWQAWPPEFVPSVTPLSQSDEDVYYIPLPGWGDHLQGFANKERFFDAARALNSGSGPSDVRVPAFAVKAPGADASLTLILGDCRGDDGTIKKGGRFPLIFQKAENGWLIFRWDVLDVISHMHGENSRIGGFTDESYWVLNQWMENYDLNNSYRVTDAQLELVTRNADGSVLQELTWRLP